MLFAETSSWPFTHRHQPKQKRIGTGSRGRVAGHTLLCKNCVWSEGSKNGQLPLLNKKIHNFTKGLILEGGIRNFLSSPFFHPFHAYFGPGELHEWTGVHVRDQKKAVFLRVFNLKKSTAAVCAVPFRVLIRRNITGDNVWYTNWYTLGVIFQPRS